jgi:hypothetical protein
MTHHHPADDFGTFSGSEHISALLTLIFLHVDQPDAIRCRTFVDLHDDAYRHAGKDVFRQRFLDSVLQSR